MSRRITSVTKAVVKLTREERREALEKACLLEEDELEEDQLQIEEEELAMKTKLRKEETKLKLAQIKRQGDARLLELKEKYSDKVYEPKSSTPADILCVFKDPPRVKYERKTKPHTYETEQSTAIAEDEYADELVKA